MTKPKQLRVYPNTDGENVYVFMAEAIDVADFNELLIWCHENIPDHYQTNCAEMHMQPISLEVWSGNNEDMEWVTRGVLPPQVIGPMHLTHYQINYLIIGDAQAVKFKLRWL